MFDKNYFINIGAYRLNSPKAKGWFKKNIPV